MTLPRTQVFSSFYLAFLKKTGLGPSMIIKWLLHIQISFVETTSSRWQTFLQCCVSFIHKLFIIKVQHTDKCKPTELFHRNNAPMKPVLRSRNRTLPATPAISVLVHKNIPSPSGTGLNCDRFDA